MKTAFVLIILPFVALVLAPLTAHAAPLSCPQLPAIVTAFERQHYTHPKLDQALKQKTATQFIKRLDPTKTALLASEVDQIKQQVLDAFLFAAGAVQIAEDHVQRDLLSVRRSAGYFGGPIALPLTAVARSVDTTRRLRPAHRRALTWCAQAAAVRDALADAVVVGRLDLPAQAWLDAAVADLRTALDRLRFLPARFSGRPVRVRMEQRFEFHLAGR